MNSLADFRDKVLKKYLLNSAEDGEVVKEIEATTLRFKDEKLESTYQTLYNETIAWPNRQLCIAGIFVTSALILWTMVSRVYNLEFYVSNLIRVLAIVATVVVIVSRKYNLFPITKEQKLIWFCFTAAFLTTTCYKWLWNVFQPVSPNIVKVPAKLDEAQNLIVFASGAYVLSNIRTCLRATIYFFIINLCVFLPSQLPRTIGAPLVLLNIASVQITALLLAYRRESYYRRIFWMKKKLDPEFTKVDEAVMIFKNLVLPTSDSINTLNKSDSNSLKTCVSGEEQGLVEIKPTPIFRLKTYIKQNFFLLNHDSAVEEQFEQFLSRQSVGQTRLTLWVMAINIIVTCLIERFNYGITDADVLMRGGLAPAILVSHAIARVLFSQRPYGYKFLRAYGVFVIVSLIALYFTGSILRRRDPNVWGNESVYVIGITHLTLVSCTAFGLRFYIFFWLGLLYLFTSAVLQTKYKYSNNGFIIGANATFFLACLYLHQYEKLMFVYFSLKTKLTNKQ